MGTSKEMIIKEGQQQVAIKEIAKRLDHYEKLHAFVTELATWDATCDSWYQLFKNFQDRATKVL